jgi:hypothetical protein
LVKIRKLTIIFKFLRACVLKLEKSFLRFVSPSSFSLLPSSVWNWAKSRPFFTRSAERLRTKEVKRNETGNAWTTDFRLPRMRASTVKVSHGESASFFLNRGKWMTFFSLFLFFFLNLTGN